jgi:hypothetical protein
MPGNHDNSTMTRQYIITETRSADKTLTLKEGEREIRLHSAYDPVKEAERSASAFDRRRASIIVVSGLGLGYHVKALSDKNPGAAIAVVEHDPRVAALAMKTFPDFLRGVSIITSPRDIEGAFELTDLAHFRGLAHYIHRPSYGMHESFYNTMFIDINRFFTSKISDLLTRFEFEQSWMANILANIPSLFDSGSVKDLFGKFAGYPGIIVSAGPSLRKNAHLLAELRDRALIVCVDTAIKALERMGVEPHLVMTLDAQKHSLRHFLGLRGKPPILLADMVSYPLSHAPMPEKKYSAPRRNTTPISRAKRRGRRRRSWTGSRVLSPPSGTFNQAARSPPAPLTCCSIADATRSYWWARTSPIRDGKYTAAAPTTTTSGLHCARAFSTLTP